MSERPRYSHEEERRIEAMLRDGRRLLCPVCENEMDQRGVPPRPDVSYVRDRLLVTCPTCHRAYVLDRRGP